MFSRSFRKQNKEIKTEIGSLLIAQPFWQDEKYKRSVILLLESDEKGRTGIILNKQTNLCLFDVIPELELGLPLYYGGPFDTRIISFVHSDPHIPDSVFLGNDLFYGGNFEYLHENIRNKNISLQKIKFYAGFVQWNCGQLESELSENKWWTGEINAQEFFTASADELWTYELLSNGHIYGMMNEFPDPGIN